MNTIVFAFRPVEDLQGQLGLIECEEDLALDLIAEDLVDDPRIGDRNFREMQPDAPMVSCAIRRRRTSEAAVKPATPEVASRETGATGDHAYDTREMRAKPALPKRKPGPPPPGKGFK